MSNEQFTVVDPPVVKPAVPRWRNPPLLCRAIIVGLVWGVVGAFCGMFSDLFTSRGFPGMELGAGVGMLAGMLVELGPGPRPPEKGEG